MDPENQNNMSFANDLAILLLQKEVALNDKISLIQLPHENAGCPSGKRPFVISGWGVDQPKNPNVPFGQAPSSRFLQAVRQECLSIDECIRKDYEQALQDLSKAHEMEPNNKGISNEMTKAKKLKMENVKKGKKFK